MLLYPGRPFSERRILSEIKFEVVMEYTWLAVFPPESVARTVNVAVPRAVGTPAMVPVVLFQTRPAVKEPDTIFKL